MAAEVSGAVCEESVRSPHGQRAELDTRSSAGDQLYTLGVTGVLSAWRVADGTLAWRKDYSSVVDTSKLFCGTAMSPMLDGGALIVQVGSDVHGGRVLAIDPATGSRAMDLARARDPAMPRRS